MKYIYNGIETTDLDKVNEMIWYKLSEENKFPSEFDVEEEFNMNVERVEEGK